MNTTIVIAILVAALIVGYLLFTKMEKANHRLMEAHQEKQRLESEKLILQERNERLSQQLKEAEEKGRNIDETMKMQFKELAQTILQEKSNSLKASSEETLQPLREEIQNFRNQITKSYADETGQRKSLEDRIRELIKQSQQLGIEAGNLTKALKGDSKVQGDWGEQILERILEDSGLQKDISYQVQPYIKDDTGTIVTNEDNKKMRPDVIVHFPDNRSIIIDSKVSLTAYANFMNTEKDEEKESFIRQHIQSVEKHIKELAEKDYSRYYERSIDFVMLFIPNEGAYNLAMQQKDTLWEQAYKKKIVIIGPTSLISTIKLVENLWDRNNQEKNIEAFMEEMEKIYDKMRLFLESFEDASAQIQKADSKMQEAKKRLVEGKGNLIDRLAKLNEMGLKPKNNLPQSYQKELNSRLDE